MPLNPARDTRVLDISASHGAYGIAFAKKNPRAHLVALDWEAVLAVAEKNATAAGLAGRFSKIVGDAYTFAEYQKMLTDSGFRDAQLHPLPPTTESAVIATA